MIIYSLFSYTDWEKRRSEEEEDRKRGEDCWRGKDRAESEAINRQIWYSDSRLEIMCQSCSTFTRVSLAVIGSWWLCTCNPVQAYHTHTNTKCHLWSQMSSILLRRTQKEIQMLRAPQCTTPVVNETYTVLLEGLVSSIKAAPVMINALWIQKRSSL